MCVCVCVCALQWQVDVSVAAHSPETREALLAVIQSWLLHRPRTMALAFHVLTNDAAELSAWIDSHMHSAVQPQWLQQADIVYYEPE